LHRLLHGWSANLVLIVLGLTQQLLLVPAFLHFWSSDTLAAWLAIYAAGSLMVIADSGLQARAINRFLDFRARADCDGRTGSFYNGTMQIYLCLVVLLGVAVVAFAQLLQPSTMLGFTATASFDSAMLVMMIGTLLILPGNLVSGLYRTRGKFARIVWLSSGALLLGQIAQIVTVALFGSLLAVAIAYISIQLLFTIFLIAIDAPRLFPFLRRGRRARSWRWCIGQLGRAIPFGVANAAELALMNLPVLLVSAFVVDRVAVAQWGLTRVVASLVRGLCSQMVIPMAAELGHDHAVGDYERLRRHYAYGSVLVTALASTVVAGLLSFWADFFALWTHGSIPLDTPLAVTLLLGAAAVSPSLLALGFANHSNRADLLIRTKGLQLVMFLGLSILLIRALGPLGAALAIIASDLGIQFGLLALFVLTQTLRHPFRHVAFLVLVAVTIVASGWGLGTMVTTIAPGSGIGHFLYECAIWLAIVGAIASPLLKFSLRARFVALIPC
jgi:O-antigen/teichoic acid export membrane protein